MADILTWKTLAFVNLACVYFLIWRYRKLHKILDATTQDGSIYYVEEEE